MNKNSPRHPNKIPKTIIIDDIGDDKDIKDYEVTFEDVSIKAIDLGYTEEMKKQLVDIRSSYEMVISQLRKDLNNHLENAFKECLKNRGFVFNNQSEFLHFVQLRCKMEDYQGSKERIFYVDDQPVFRWIYEYDVKWKDSHTVTATSGSYQCL